MKKRSLLIGGIPLIAVIGYLTYYLSTTQVVSRLSESDAIKHCKDPENTISAATRYAKRPNGHIALGFVWDHQGLSSTYFAGYDDELRLNTLCFYEPTSKSPPSFVVGSMTTLKEIDPNTWSLFRADERINNR